MAYQLPAQRMLAAICADPTIGLNAQIGLLAAAGLLDGSDAAPPLFGAGAIADETTDPTIAQGDFPEGDPALAILQPQSWDAPIELFTINGTRTADGVPVMLRYRRPDVDLSQAVQDWEYTARAYLRMVREVTRAAYENSHRTKCHLRIVSFGATTLLAPFKTKESVICAGGLIQRLELRDIKP